MSAGSLSQRESVRRVVQGLAGEERLERARAFGTAVMDAYWTAMVPGYPMAPRAIATESLPHDLATLAQQIGREYAVLSAPLATYSIGCLYTGLLPPEMRSANGVFYTPPPLVDRMLDLAEAAGIDWGQHSIADPAAGCGAFVVPVMTRIVKRLTEAGVAPNEIIAAVQERVLGIELDPFSGWMAWVFAEVCIWSTLKSASCRLANPVLIGDSLHLAERLGRRYDLVIGNPPYGRVTLQAEVRNHFSRSIFGHANLYGIFTDLGIRLLCPGGVLAFVTPTSFLGGLYFRNLRAVLATEARPLALDLIEQRTGVFEDVLQETLLLVCSRHGDNRASSPVAVCTNRPIALDAPCVVTRIGAFTLPETPHDPWMVPRDPDDARLLQGAQASSVRLADYGLRVSTGPLVWNRNRGQLGEHHITGSKPIIWAESIRPNGTFAFVADRRNHLPYYLPLPGQEHLVQRDACILLRRTSAKEQRRRLVAALLPEEFIQRHDGVVVENHVNVIRYDPALGVGPLTQLRLAAVSAYLNSSTADRLFRCLSGSVAVSATELEALPLPPEEIMLEAEQLLATPDLDEGLERLFASAFEDSR